MENPGGDLTYSRTFVHGARMLVIRGIPCGPEAPYRIRTFDFSRLGSATLPLLDGNNGGTERRAVLGDGRSNAFKKIDCMTHLESSGDSIMVYIVSALSHSTGDGIAD